MELFGLVAFWFFALLLAFILLITVNEERFFPTSILIAALSVALTWKYGFTETFSWITSNWVLFGLGVVGYLGLGILWSFFKWDRYISERIEEVKKAWDRYSDPKNTGTKKIETFAEYVEESGSVPVALNRKEKIACWIFYWPLSIVLYVIGDFLREFINWVVRYFGNVYTAITNRHINKYK